MYEDGIYSQNINDQLVQHTLSGWVYLFIEQIIFIYKGKKEKKESLTEDTCEVTTTKHVNWN